MKTWIRNHQLISFFILSYFIMTGTVLTSIILRPGQPDHPWSISWFFYAFSPTYSALIISWIIGGKDEVKHLLLGFTRWKVGLRWYFSAAFLFLGPLAFSLVVILLGNQPSGLKAGTTARIILGQLLFTLFSGPLAEEGRMEGICPASLAEEIQCTDLQPGPGSDLVLLAYPALFFYRDLHNKASLSRSISCWW